ncbi:zinc-ribbon domain-containing protein [bacterium]|nr:MAG: zinc-ribbon domain-containing protein [bacterium]
MAEYICPHCKNPIYDDDALLCLYCGESLGRKRGFLKYTPIKVLFAVIVLLVIVSFAFLVLR